LEVYAGRNGGVCGMPTTAEPSSGGGGGSIGRTAARDLAVRATFYPGSGGGGGGSYGVTGTNPRLDTGCGGGGGGGAVRVESPTRIVVSRGAEVRASGGNGGTGSSHSGGGGSGGVIVLAAPSISLFGSLRAMGGAGGARSSTDCGRGGAGGLGRIRLSVDPVRCEVTGTSNPPIPTGCAPSPDGGVPGQAYVGVWPN
jgi:hypothetical protein